MQGEEGKVKGNPRFLAQATEKGRCQSTVIKMTCSGSQSIFTN